MLRFESSHLPYYADLLAREQIKCDFHITTAYDVCLNPKMAEIGRRGYQARLKDFPEDMKAFLELDDPEHLQRLSQVKGALWGCAYKVGSIHPYKLVNGLLRACLRKESFNLQTDTPVTSLSHTGSQWKVDTPRGTVEAAKVVVCTNGYMSNLLPQFANKIVPIKGPCSALAIPPPQPLTIPSNQRFRPLFTTYSLKNDVHDFDYMISRQEEPNHIVVGGGHEAFEHRPGEWYGNADDSTQMYVMAISRSAQAKDSDGTERYFLDFMPKHFINYPERESRLAHLWTGSESRRSWLQLS
jgi:glycine/D-amino acid oxidase-like deaminating enzyme